MPEVRVRRELQGGASLEALRNLVGRPRPASIRQLLTDFEQPLTFSEPLVTGDDVALGGQHQVTLQPDGRWRFEGHFRATGWPSYRVSLASRVEGANGAIIGFAAQGEVHGSNEPGDRDYSFTEEGQNPLIALHWADLRAARLVHDLQYDADFFGTPGDILAFIGKFAAAATVVGGAGVVMVCGSEAIDRLGGHELAVPGTVGIIVAGGIVAVVGMSAMIPAVIAGAAAGAAVADAIEQRPLEPAERDFADQVYAGSIPWDRVLLSNVVGFGGRPFTCPGPGGTILVNLGEGVGQPTTYRGNGGPEMKDGKWIQAPGQLLIHELCHAWQIAHSEFIPGLMCTGIVNQLPTLGGDMSVYEYGTASQNWDEFNLEQQASIIDDWFAGSSASGTALAKAQQLKFPPMATAGPPDPDANPYWHFVRDNIRPGVR